jgi:hypothetical protein
MPIYVNFEGRTGTITGNSYDGGFIESGASGGVWKTTNFLTAGSVPVSRISFSNGGGVDAQEALPTRKAAELFERASSGGNRGKLIVGVDTVETFDKQGRLLVGTEGGIWSGHNSGALRNVSGSNTFSRPGIGVLKSTDSGRTWNTKKVPVVELTVTDRGGTTGKTFRLKDVTVAPGAKGMLELSYSSIEM